MQRVLRIVVAAGLAVFVVCTALMFFGVSVERVAFIVAGVVTSAVGLEMLGQALFPNWNRDWWKPLPGKPATVPLGRLSCVAAAISWGGMGVFFFGHDWLPDAAYVAIILAVVAGFGLMWVCWSLDKRAAEPRKLDDESLSSVDRTR